ncbi:MAG: adenylate/guanylate cyclase domain-containing protein [Alphaproteobacteria bacterium]
MSQILENSDIRRLSDWICEQGLLGVSLETLLDGFCQRLSAAGLPLARVYLSAQTLHPRIAGVGNIWRPGEGVKIETYFYRSEPSAAFLESPIKYVIDHGMTDLRVRLEGNEPLAFPVCEELRAKGGTDYLIQLAKFGRDGRPDGKTGAILSWTTSAPGGFDDHQLAILRFLAPRLALAVQIRTAQDITINLLEAYVGSAAGRLIIDGDVRRGDLDVISSVILLADLQGFTAMSERTRHDDLVDMLNQYFDCLVGPIVERGGNVLKFLGDGLLATFPLNGEPADDLCEHALDAAADILERVALLKRERQAAGKPVMILDIALHLGDVYWGNVGSAERLDFTVVGPAVNEAARIETLCAQYERNLLVSETFAKAATRSAHRLVSIGRFALRGVRSAQSIYTLEDMVDPAGSTGRD